MTSSIAAPTHYLRPSNNGPNRRRLPPEALPPSLTSRNHTLTPPPSAQSSIKPNCPPGPPTPPTSLPQTQSPFLSLPPELRLQIYTTLLGGPNVPVHIVRTRTRLTSIRCWMPHEQNLRHGCLGTLEPHGVFVGWLASNKKLRYGNDEGRMAIGMQGMLPLLQTCRFVYAEGIVLLYSTPMFMINNMKGLGWWRESALAKRFRAVRALDLSFSMRLRSSEHGGEFAEDDEWQGFWRVVRSMEGLRVLRVRLRGRARAREFRWEVEGEMLEPLERLRQVLDFEVLVPWGISEDGEGSAVHERKQRPFRLVRSVAAT